MAPIDSESKGGDRPPPRRAEPEKLDALWATFRLPVPIAAAVCDPSLPDGEWPLRALDLLRLLRRMDERLPNAGKRIGGRGISSALERKMRDLTILARADLARLERTLPTLPERSPAGDCGGDDPSPVFYENCHRLLEKLRNDTEETCAKCQRWMDLRASQRHAPDEPDLIYDLFLAPADAPSDDEDDSELLDDLGTDEEDEYDEIEDAQPTSEEKDDVRPAPPRVRVQSQPRPEPPRDPAELQALQQEMLEEELASMAARLKSSTLAMNATLQDQTKDLDKMEELAQTNLDQVSDTTKKVEDRLTRKRGWKKRLATWSLIGTVAGTWVLCFMVIRTVPKRQVGKSRAFEGVKYGFRKAWGGLFGKEDKKRRERQSWHEREEEAAPDGRRQRQEEDARRRREEKLENWQRQQREEERRRREQWRDSDAECEVLADGSQVCTEPADEAGRMEAKARELAAERRRRRIEQNMANAPAVDAEEAGPDDDADGAASGTAHEETGSDGGNIHESAADPTGCIPPTEEMLAHQSAIDSLEKGLEGIDTSLQGSREGSTRRMQLSRQREKLRSRLAKHASGLDRAKNEARDSWAEIHGRPGSVPFCDGDAAWGAPSADRSDEGVGTDAGRGTTDRGEALRGPEDERRAEVPEAAVPAEEARGKAEEGSAAAEGEMPGQADGRVGTETEELVAPSQASTVENAEREPPGQNDDRRLETEHTEREQWSNHDGEEAPQTKAAKVEQQRRVAEAEAAEQAKLEMERIEQERVLAEQQKKMAEEKQRIGIERAEAARLAQERLAADAAKQARLEKLERDRMEQEQVLAERRKKAEEQEQLARLEQARRTAEEEQRAELERLERERIGRERTAAEAEAGLLEEERLAAEAEEARLEAERLERERVVAEEKKAAEEEATRREELERLEKERIAEERQREEEEAQRLAAEQEAARLEQEELAAAAEREEKEAQRIAASKAEEEAARQEEAARREELERLEKERIAEERQKEEEEARRLAAEQEAARLEQEKLAVAAAAREEKEAQRIAAEEEAARHEEAARREELERLEKERIAEERQREEEEAQRLAAEQEAARLEQEKLAAAAAEEEKKAQRIAAAKAQAEAEANEAMELSKGIASENPVFSPADVRYAAGRLRNDLLAHYISKSPDVVDASDRGGWRPIHEAARAGNLAGVQLLISAGCDLASRTGRTGNGGTALWWAIQRYGHEHNIVLLLRSYGAPDDGPKHHGH